MSHLAVTLSTEHGSLDQFTRIFRFPGRPATLEEQLGKIPSQGPQLFGFIHELRMSCLALQRLVFPRDTFVNVKALHMYALDLYHTPQTKQPKTSHSCTVYYLYGRISVSVIT